MAPRRRNAKLNASSIPSSPTQRTLQTFAGVTSDRDVSALMAEPFPTMPAQEEEQALALEVQAEEDGDDGDVASPQRDVSTLSLRDLYAAEPTLVAETAVAQPQPHPPTPGNARSGDTADTPVEPADVSSMMQALSFISMDVRALNGQELRHMAYALATDTVSVAFGGVGSVEVRRT